MLENFKLKIEGGFRLLGDAITIQSQEDYVKARAWLIKAAIVCGICSVLGILYGLFLISMIGDDLGILSIPIFLILGQWSLWGTGTFLLNIREIFNVRRMAEAGMIGFTAGSGIKETHVTVEHEFGNQYKATAYTESKGCKYALIAIFIRFIAWMYFSVIVGAFLTVKKLIETIRNIRDYQKNQA